MSSGSHLLSSMHTNEVVQRVIKGFRGSSHIIDTHHNPTIEVESTYTLIELSRITDNYDRYPQHLTLYSFPHHLLTPIKELIRSTYSSVSIFSSTSLLILRGSSLSIALCRPSYCLLLSLPHMPSKPKRFCLHAPIRGLTMSFCHSVRIPLPLLASGI